MSYNHAYTVAFEVISDDADGEDVTPAMFKAALLKRIASMDENDEWEEAVGAPYDTFEVEAMSQVEITVTDGMNPDRWGPNGEDLFNKEKNDEIQGH